MKAFDSHTVFAPAMKKRPIVKSDAPKCFLVVCFGIVACWLLLAAEVAAQDAVERLFQRVEKIPGHLATDDSCQVPSLIQGPSRVKQMGYRPPVDVAQQLGDAPPLNDPDFSTREVLQLDPRAFFPPPIGRRTR